MTDCLAQIAPDIYQLRLPLPFALRIVNVYLLRGDEGWTVVDTGLHTPDGEQVWREALDALGIRPGQIEQIVLTHVHPDHYGMAGWLQAWSGDGIAPPVRLSARERELADRWWLNPPDRLTAIRGLFRQCGLDGEGLEHAMSAFGAMRPLTAPQPDRLEIIEYGSPIRLGGREFMALHTPGHADGHLIFYDAADRLLLCGDHVLMTITPNIGLWPDSEPDPLARYLGTLGWLGELDVRLALPGHRRLIEDWGGRLDELKAHHAERLQHALDGVNGGVTVYEVSRHLFEMDAFTPHEVRFALAETLAHLEYLRGQETLAREGEQWRYFRV